MPRQTTPIISVKDALNRLTTDPQTIFIDIRDKKDYTSEHISKAINIPFEKFEIKNYMLSRAYKYIIYCEHGGTSMQVALQLVKDNFKAETLAGGFEAYKRYIRTHKSPN